MKIILVKLFRRLQSADLNGAGYNLDKGVFMIYRRLSQFLTAAALAIAFVAFAGVAGGSEAKAQGIYRNYNWNRNAIIRQRERERYLRLRREQFRREEWRRHNRFDHSRYDHRRFPYYRRW
jgi:hypothetical protein